MRESVGLRLLVDCGCHSYPAMELGKDRCRRSQSSAAAHATHRSPRELRAEAEPKHSITTCLCDCGVDVTWEVDPSFYLLSAKLPSSIIAPSCGSYSPALAANVST